MESNNISIVHLPNFPGSHQRGYMFSNSLTEVYRHETLAAAVKGSGVVGVMTSGLLAQAAFASVQACR
jgi:hypothetical protein